MPGGLRSSARHLPQHDRNAADGAQGMMSADGYSRPAVAGSGTIACSLAAAASALGEVRLLARSDVSAWRAEESIEGLAGKVDGAAASRVKVTTKASALADCDLVVEAIKEDLEAKVELLS